MQQGNCEPHKARVLVFREECTIAVVVTLQPLERLDDEQLVDLRRFLEHRVAQLVEEWDS